MSNATAHTAFRATKANANAALYRCAWDLATGDWQLSATEWKTREGQACGAPGFRRPKVNGRQYTLCEAHHADAYTYGRAVARGADGFAALPVVERLAFRAAAGRAAELALYTLRIDAETVADALESGNMADGEAFRYAVAERRRTWWVKTVTEYATTLYPLAADDAVAAVFEGGCPDEGGRVVNADALIRATLAIRYEDGTNYRARTISFDPSMAAELFGERMVTGGSGEALDADALDLLDLEDALILEAFAARETPDGRPATKHEATAYAADVCLPNEAATDGFNLAMLQTAAANYVLALELLRTC